MDQGKQLALAAVEQLTGATGLYTCPNYYCLNTDIANIERLLEWKKSGQLALVLADSPSVALVEAMELIDKGLAKRKAIEEKELQEEYDRKMELQDKHRG